MIYLSKPSSFNIKLDNNSHSLILEEGIRYDDVLEGTLDYVRPCLLNPDLDVPIHLYRVYQNLHNEADKSLGDKVEYDLLLMPPNVTGVEYVKTHGHKTPEIPGKDLTYPVIIEILYGAGTFILQKFNNNFDPFVAVEPEISEVYMLKAQKGTKVIIPPNFYYTLINTRGTYLVTGRLHHCWDMASERLKLEEKQGTCYYVIRKNARQEIVKNPNYKNTPRLMKIKHNQINKIVGFRSSKPLSTLIRKNPEKFKFLTNPSKFDWIIES